MTSRLYDTTYLDVYGNRVVWDNSVNRILYYSATGESWDRSGGGNTSWYLESSLPHDSFYGSALSQERWSYFNYRGTASCSVDDCLKLSVVNAEARGGVTSDGLWKISGDFDIRVYLDETSYYNEYRSNVSSGLTLSIDDSNKYRISKYCDGTYVGFKSSYILNSELKYFGWGDNGDLNTDVGEPVTTCLRLVREGDIVSSYVSTSSGFERVGNSVSGTVWGQDANVEIEIETEQFNTFSVDVLGFTVSGTLDSSKVFSSSYRGGTQEFPENSILLVDDNGMSIIDDSDKSLWMRFVAGDENMFRSTSSRLSALEGKIYYTTVSGVFCLDFANDRAVNYKRGSTLYSISSIASRNYKTSFYSSGSNGFMTDDEVLDLSAKKVDGTECLAVATVNGVGMLLGSESKQEYPLSGRVQRTYISSDGRLYWNQYNISTGDGKLYYREGISGLIGGSETFTYSSYYDTSTSVPISSEDIRDIYVDSSSGHRLVLAHSCGIDYIDGLISNKYGPDVTVSTIQDPGFSSYLGIYWNIYDSSSSSNLSLPGNSSVGVFPSLSASISSYWSTVGSTSLKLSSDVSTKVISGDYRGVYQQLDFTSIHKIYFDFKLVNNTGVYSTNYYDLEVLIGNTTVASYSDTSESYTSLNNVIDVSSYNGLNFLIFRIKSKYSGDSIPDISYYVDNVRISQITPDYPIIESSDHTILEAILLYGNVDRKIYFANSEGFGAIDLVSNTLDFFNSIDDFVSLSTIISSEYVEVVDEV